MSEILLKIKPIMIPDLKNEVEISINPLITPVELVFQINEMYGIEGNYSFLFKGKKLTINKTLKEQEIDKDNIKLLMNKSKEPLIPIAKLNETNNDNDSSNKNSINDPNDKMEVNIYNNMNLTPTYQKIENVRNQMNSKYKDNSKALELIESLLKTMPHKEEMSEDELIMRVEQFIMACLPKTIENYYLSLSENDTAILDDENLTSIFGQGNNTNGQLGIGNYISIDIPIRINNLKQLKITQIACGVGHTIALTDNNLIYAWGRFYKPENKNDKIMSTSGDYPYPTLIESLSNESIIKIAAGNNHSMAITELGDLYTWGEGIYGQLGHGINNNEQYPKKIEYFCKKFKIIDCKGGAAHTIALTEEGYLFGWGQSDKNQLNLSKLTNVNKPYLLLLYEFDNNLTIDEYKFLEQNDEEGTNVNLYNNELSTDIESLMKIESIICGTWYTVVTSRMFYSTLFLFGNKYKRVIKIDFFENNKYEIKQITASSRYVYVLTSNDKIFSINVDELMSDKITIIEEINVNEIKDIKKIECGLDYLLLLNDNNQCFYIEKKNKNIIKLLNEDIKGDIFDISSGDSFFFLNTKLNSIGFYENLFEEIKKYSNINDTNSIFNTSKSFDIILSQKNDSLIKYACHSYIFELFIDTKKLEKDLPNNKNNINAYLIPSLKNEEILLLLEILYTNNINWDNLKKDIDKYMELDNIMSKILDFMNNYGKETTIKSMKDLIALYKDKITRYINNYKKNNYILTQEEKTQIIMKMILKSFNAVVKSSTGSLFEEEEKKLKEEELKKQKMGTQISLFEVTNLNASLNIDYYKQYKLECEYIFSFYKKIAQLKKEINSFKKEYIKKNMNNSFSFILKYNNNEFHLNKDIVSQKSKYFNNIINIMNLKQFSLDDID
jgi:alpha-tubulin suppressor-like RCC1 family protein